jgi:flagellar hook assembly protein FlgD
MHNRIKSLPLFFREPEAFHSPRSGNHLSRGGYLFLVVMLMNLISCKFPTSADDPTVVSNLRFTPSAFDSFTKNTEVQYTLKNPVTVNISIVKKDSSGQEFLVRTIAEDIRETKGTHRHTWLGDTEKGLFAPIGTYIGIVQTESQRFETTVLVFHF